REFYRLPTSTHKPRQMPHPHLPAHRVAEGAPTAQAIAPDARWISGPGRRGRGFANGMGRAARSSGDAFRPLGLDRGAGALALRIGADGMGPPASRAVPG